MSRSRMYSLLCHLHRAHYADANHLPDAELLERFARLRDEAAFELLVWRHERMVLGVCRRLLHDEHDAEDSFQAAFLTLARKAASISRREAVASWLYRVAYRCALRVRESVRRQQKGIIRSVDPASLAVSDPSLAAVDQNDFRELLDEEVQRLPAKYREAVVLCYLEGKSYQQAAQELGCPAGTLSARLHTAREKLRRQLTARGFAPAAALALLEGVRETHASARLAAVAVQAAERIIAGQSAANVVSSRTLEIANGVMQAMSASKPKIIAAVLLMGCLSCLTGWAALRALPQPQQQQRAENADKPPSSKKGGKMATWQECARLCGAIGGKSFHVEFTPDSGALAAIDGDGILRAWNTSDWKQRWQYDLRRHYGYNFQYFTFSPDGRHLRVHGVVTDMKKPKEETTLLDAASGQELARLPGSRLDYAPNKAMLATAQKEGITLWDTRAFRKKREFKTDSPPETSFVIEFSKDASLVCVATKAGRCHLWETATGKERARPEGSFPVFSPDGKTLLTMLPGGVIKLWDTADGRERAAIRKAGRTGCMYGGFSADSKLVLVRDFIGMKANGSPDLPEQPAERKARIRPVGVYPIGIYLYDATTGEERKSLPGRLPGENLYDVCVQLAPDGRTVAYTRLEADENKRTEVVLWDVQSGRERAVLRRSAGLRTPRFSLAVPFSPDGAALLTTDPSSRNLRLWDVATGQRLLDLPAEVGFVHFSPDGQWLAGVPGNKAGDIRVFHRSDHPLPPPLIRGEAVKPSPPQR
jgi:RNA polymerase sigma factor (sigma-70 family)